jgi:hypothetical protein
MSLQSATCHVTWVGFIASTQNRLRLIAIALFSISNYNVNCIVLCDDTSHIFLITIIHRDNVGALKDLININFAT